LVIVTLRKVVKPPPESRLNWICTISGAIGIEFAYILNCYGVDVTIVEFLDRILARLTFPGALYLAAVAALPTILTNQTAANFAFGGTSLLIVVGVALDTMKQLEAQLMMRNYEGFLK